MLNVDVSCILTVDIIVLLVILNLSVPDVENPIELTEGLKIPVLVSDENEYDGKLFVPFPLTILVDEKLLIFPLIYSKFVPVKVGNIPPFVAVTLSICILL